MNIVNEPGLYSLALGSRKPQAKAFKRWITHEVIPSIRKHGAYMTPEAIAKALMTPDGAITLLTVLKDEQEKNRALNNENAALAEQRLKWDERKFIVAAVRKFSSACVGWEGSQFGSAWKEYKKELLYKHGINLEHRITNMRNESSNPQKIKLMDALRDDELRKGISTIVAMCREKNVDISDLLKNIDYQETRSRRRF